MYQDFPILIHALMSLGVPFALIAPYSTPRELDHTLALSKVTTVFVGARQAKKRGYLWPKGTNVLIINGRVDGRVCLSDMLEKNAGSGKYVPVVEVTTDHLAYLVFSSGTSGLPKGKQAPHSLPCIDVIVQPS